jgi:hypothetical protein
MGIEKRGNERKEVRKQKQKAESRKEEKNRPGKRG